MVTAIVLLHVQRGHVKDVAESLAALAGISEVYSVSGNYDLVAMIRVPENQALADLVTDHIAKVDGITGTETMLAFRAYSKHDLEAMFSIGR